MPGVIERIIQTSTSLSTCDTFPGGVPLRWWVYPSLPVWSKFKWKFPSAGLGEPAVFTHGYCELAALGAPALPQARSPLAAGVSPRPRPAASPLLSWHPSASAHTQWHESLQSVPCRGRGSPVWLPPPRPPAAIPGRSAPLSPPLGRHAPAAPLPPRGSPCSLAFSSPRTPFPPSRRKRQPPSSPWSHQLSPKRRAKSLRQVSGSFSFTAPAQPPRTQTSRAKPA